MTPARALLLVALVVVAFGAMAATLDAGSLSLDDDGEDRRDCPPDAPDCGGSGPAPNRTSLNESLTLPPVATCSPPLTDPAAFTGVVAAVGLVAAVVGRRRDSLLPALAVAAPVVLVLGALCPYYWRSRLAALAPLSDASVPPLAVVVGLVAALGGALALLSVVAGEEVRDAADASGPEDLQAVGEAAGEAADRIEADADVANAVYRAWREMVGHLDVPNPDSTAPDEFADAAVAAGMSPDEVRTLTRLFEEVRYGDRDAESREERAVTALRRIEAAYAGEGER